MRIDRLTKAVKAAGFAMVNSEEDYYAPGPSEKAVEPAPAWKPASSTALVPAPKIDIAYTSSLRDWWHSLGGRATA
jgi:hypothetical protein